MGVKKPVKKKVAKKKVKPRLQTAICEVNESHEIYCGELDCPYCGTTMEVESEYEPPDEGFCDDCNKKFKIKWED